MPIILDQYRLRELGRIRMGIKSGNRPTKLNTWRLTSASKELLEAVAEKYGGEVQVWEDAPNDGEHFEIVTTSDTLNILVPPGDSAFSQWMEMWSGGGCKRRCDGRNQVLRDVPCACPAEPDERRELAKDGKACKETTRFNVMLPDIPDVGVWRLETHGYYAAVELAAFQQLAQVATAQGSMIRARLRIDHRTSKKGGEGSRPQTFKYTVPVVEISHSVGDMLQALGADVTDLAVSLPGPIEHKSLPGTRPELPAQAAGWDEQSRTEGGLTEAASVPAELATAPPSVSSDWLADLRTRFSDRLIIATAEQVRFEEYGEGTPITTLDGVQTAETVNLHTAIIDRLNNQGRRNAEEGSTPEAPAEDGNTEPQAIADSTSSDASVPASGPQQNLGGDGGQEVGASAPVPSEIQSNGHSTRERVVALISNAVDGNVNLGRGRARATETYIVTRYGTAAAKKELPVLETFDEVMAEGDESILAELADAWQLEEKLGATV